MTPRPLSNALLPARRPVSVFAGADVCEVAGLRVVDGAIRPVFDQDRWVFSHLADAHRMISDYELIWDFTQIANPAWRVVAKEILLAQLAPQHQAVLECSHALRTARGPRTCFTFLERYVEWFNWLTQHGITGLEQVTQEMCERWVEERSWTVPKPGRPRRRVAAYSTVTHVRVIQLISWYGDLLSTDGYRDGFIPWKGKTSTEVVGYRSKGPNRTPVVPDSLLQPMLATCLYLVNEVGPHLADLVEAVRATKAKSPVSGGVTLKDLPALRRVLERIRTDGQPLPAVDGIQVRRRTTLGEEGPLKHLAWEVLARTIGARRFNDDARLLLIPELTTLAAEVGFQRPLARQAPAIPRRDDGEAVPWTSPLAELDLAFMVDHVVSACLVVTCALSGMRTSELLELEAGCRSPVATTMRGGRRFKLASRLIKRQKFGGVPDEWVVIEEVDHAVALAERLTGRSEGEALFGTIDLNSRLKNLRGWLERTGNREHWGLPAIPTGPVNARMLRRTLALAIAERPGGLLAAKIALKHISVATTEGYAARPGGSQQVFHAEIEEAEETHHVQLTVQAFRDFQAGRMPAGPGARGLIDAFSHVDATLKDSARTAPKVLTSDRHLENLLRKQAKTLYVGVANYCWFRDPAKALCLRMAGTPDARKPLAGMCDSSRCPQATHHPCHRPAWAGHAQTLDAFIANPRIAKGEKIRLATARERVVRVVAEIDAAASAVPAARS